VKDLWSSDYVRTLDPPVIQSTESNEDQNVGQGGVLKYKPKDDLLLDDWVYDGHSVDDTPNYRDVEPPLKAMYASTVIYLLYPFQFSYPYFQFRALAWLLL
jgi:hypothetical protein